MAENGNSDGRSKSKGGDDNDSSGKEFGKIMNVTIVYLNEEDDNGCGRPELRAIQEMPLYKPELPGSVSGSCTRSSSYGEGDDTLHQEG